MLVHGRLNYATKSDNGSDCYPRLFFETMDRDAATLIDKVMAGEMPPLRINGCQTKAKKQEQAIFANLLKGVYGRFRTPTGQAAKTDCSMDLQDAEDLMTVASMAHRRLDGAHVETLAAN